MQPFPEVMAYKNGRSRIISASFVGKAEPFIWICVKADAVTPSSSKVIRVVWLTELIQEGASNMLEKLAVGKKAEVNPSSFNCPFNFSEELKSIFGTFQVTFP